MKKKCKISYKSFLGSCLALGVCLASFSVAAQEILVVDKVQEPTPVDFPTRSSLSEVKEMPLPSMSDDIIKEPSPMERVVSKKELPSEQLLGRITSEVFHEMADLERGNVFLKLQAQREELKNNLEDLKAKYRQARLDEIEKREDIIRTRVKWQQEQERIRQEMLEKKLKTELLEKELEAAEMAKEELLPLDEDPTEIKEEKVEIDEVETKVVEEPEKDVEEVIETKKEPVFTITQILNIKGMKGNLTAQIVDNSGKASFVKAGAQLPMGYVVKEINRTDITLEKDGVLETFNIEELAEKNAKSSNVEVMKKETKDSVVETKAQDKASKKADKSKNK